MSHLPQKVIDAICKRNAHLRDLPVRLQIMPIIERRKFIGKGKKTSYLNAIEFSRKSGCDVYHGYFVRVNGDSVSMVPHTFCVKDGFVWEPSAAFHWNVPCYYVGIRVPKEDIPSHRFLSLFERMDYIRKNL